MQAVKQILNTNVNVNQTKGNNVKRSNVTGTEVQKIARYIAEKLQDYNSVDFFCKMAWQIPEYKLMSILEMSMKGHSPKKLFTYLCKLELKKLSSAL